MANSELQLKKLHYTALEIMKSMILRFSPKSTVKFHIVPSTVQINSDKNT